ncbi:unnamed protein product [Schistocephalus solidus]|uniref:WAP domain-containing protein n=1 Tax=Schistocephalus solidus TaxID=70667 RepID=A0A183SLT8_SCHSO|nr:unnamed protein product [Schistocephalus solidus]
MSWRGSANAFDVAVLTPPPPSSPSQIPAQLLSFGDAAVFTSGFYLHSLLQQPPGSDVMTEPRRPEAGSGTSDWRSASESVSSGCQLGCLLLEECSYSRPGTCPARMRSVPPNAEPEGEVDAEQRDDNVDEDSPATDVSQHMQFTRSVSQSSHQACLKECHGDTSCPILHQKCCHYGCNSVCSEPLYSETVPPLPPPLRLTTIPDRPGAMSLAWAGNYTDFSRLHGPVVFVLQTRFCACKYFDQAHVSSWQTLIMVGVAKIFSPYSGLPV